MATDLHQLQRFLTDLELKFNFREEQSPRVQIAFGPRAQRPAQGGEGEVDGGEGGGGRGAARAHGTRRCARAVVGSDALRRSSLFPKWW